jgi:phosphoglycolate phosphatase
LGLSADEALYVGDSETDILTAEAAGIKAVAVLWGFRKKDELKAAGAAAFAEYPADLLKYL